MIKKVALLLLSMGFFVCSSWSQPDDTYNLDYINGFLKEKGDGFSARVYAVDDHDQMSHAHDGSLSVEFFTDSEYSNLVKTLQFDIKKEDFRPMYEGSSVMIWDSEIYQNSLLSDWGNSFYVRFTFTETDGTKHTDSEFEYL